MNSQIEKQIRNSNTFREYLEILQNSFDCKNSKPSGFIKSTLVWQIMSKLREYDIKVSDEVKKKVLASVTMHEFIQIILDNFDLNTPLNENAQKKLVYTTRDILALTRLKENPIKVEPPKRIVKADTEVKKKP
jgi:hypothetical protein